MQEYAFPSGREIQPLGSGDGSWSLHAGLSAVLILSIVVLIWRTRRPASGWDIPVWMLAIFAEWNLASWIVPNAHNDDLVLISFILMLLVAVMAISVAGWRLIPVQELKIGFVCLIAGSLAVILILPAVQQAREAARRTQCKNQLKQIGLAIGNYVDSHGQYPFAGKVVSDSEQVCSWRVAIWPYREAIPFPDVYHLKEPWNSPFNLQCLNSLLK